MICSKAAVGQPFGAVGIGQKFQFRLMSNRQVGADRAVTQLIDLGKQAFSLDIKSVSGAEGPGQVIPCANQEL